jgi:hypothetical protein
LTQQWVSAALQVIQGLDWVREHYEAPAVVVMALGGEAQYALDMAVRALVQSGVTVVVAAGNEDADACSKSPARCGSASLSRARCVLIARVPAQAFLCKSVQEFRLTAHDSMGALEENMLMHLFLCHCACRGLLC